MPNEIEKDVTTSDVIKKITPIKLEEKNAEEYIKYIQNLADKRDPSDIYYNEGKPYASILMATLLCNTHTSLKMYCTGLRPGILCGKYEGDGKGYEGAYWTAFKDFFTESNIKKISNKHGKIQILIQKKNWIGNLPFKRVFDCQKKCPGTIEVRWIKKKGISNLFSILHNNNSIGKDNFAIFDGRAYRIEYDPDRFMASGSFNDVEMCTFLSKIFDKEFESATEITSPLD